MTHAERMLVFIGPSGAGKSSVVRELVARGVIAERLGVKKTIANNIFPAGPAEGLGQKLRPRMLICRNDETVPA